MKLKSVEFVVVEQAVQVYKPGYRYQHLINPETLVYYRVKPGVEFDIPDEFLEPITWLDHTLQKGTKLKQYMNMDQEDEENAIPI